MDYSTENVEAAVVEFYSNPGKVNKECHEWLKTCQSSREAWQIVWPLLEPTKMLQVQFVSANMLHYKVSRCLNEIPESEYPGLKDRLVATVAKYIAGPSVVLTRLCLTLGAFVTNTIGIVWVNPLDDLAAIFSPQNFPGVPEVTVLRLLIQVFGYIPEQAQSQWQSSVRKGQAYKELQEKGQTMYSWLFNVVKTQKDMELIVEGLKALNSWMKMICVFEWPEFFDFINVVCSYCVSSCTSEDSEQLTDLTLEILSGIIGDPTAHQYPSVMLKTLDKIIPLQSSLDVILERQDMELASSFYGMYVAFADCHSKLVVDVCDPENVYSVNNPTNRDNALTLIKMLLQCTDYPGVYPVDEIVSNMTISVWYSLVEDIQSHQLERLKYVRIMQVYEEVYQTLAKILIKKAKFPLDASDWNSEEKEQFRVYRQDVCDCLTYCFELRGWTVLNELVDWSEVHLQAIDANPDEVHVRWPELESLLMGIRAVAENISDETDPVVVSPMNRVFSIVYRILKLNSEGKNPKLFQAAIECVSSCSGMLHMYDTVVRSIIGFILEGLFQPEIWTSAALAMKTLSRDCTKCLSDFTPQILSSCKQVLECGRLSQSDCNRIVFCIGRFLPYLPPDQIITAVNEIFSPCLSQLQTLAVQDPQPELKTQLIGILNIFSTLCLSLDAASSEDDEDDDEPDLDPNESSNNNNASQAVAATSPNRAQPLVPVVEQILPVLIPVAEKWAKDEEAIEALFSIVKHTLSTIHSSSMTVIQYSMQLVLISFRLNPLTSATSVAKQTILMLGKENRPTQCQFLGEMHRLCAERLKDTRDTDFLESYLQFIGQLIKSSPDLVNSAGISLDLMLHMSIESLNVMETAMVKSAIFFTTITMEKSSILVPPRREYFKAHGPTIIQKILLAIGYVVPRSHCQHFADLFISMNKHFTAEWRKWLSECLAVDGFPSTHANQEHKTKFYMKVTRDRANKRAIQDAISEFAIACRNMSGSEYASATSKRLL